MPEQASGGASPSGAFGRFSASVLALGRIRLELLAIEVQEEKERIASMLVWAVVAAFLGCFALVFLALFITLLLWDSHRLLALGGFTALFLVLAAVGVLRLRELFGTGSSLFQSTIAELREDSRALKQPPTAP
jgi:uncharacterized membrane protein YqjE